MAQYLMPSAGGGIYSGNDHSEEELQDWKNKLAASDVSASEKPPEFTMPASVLKDSSGGYPSQSTAGVDVVSPALSGGTALAMGSPAAAGITVAGSLLAQSMANEAQAAQNKRQRAIDIANNHSRGEQAGLDQLMQAYKGALR